jgi:hypothetical protein
MLSPFEYGYGTKHITNSRDKKIITIINVPHRTSVGGISPSRFLTFSERSSMFVSF